MAAKKKGPTKSRKNLCLHCKTRERVSGVPHAVYCRECIGEGRRATDRVIRAIRYLSPRLRRGRVTLTGEAWWERKPYRDADRAAYLEALMAELENGLDDGDPVE